MWYPIDSNFPKRIEAQVRAAAAVPPATPVAVTVPVTTAVVKLHDSTGTVWYEITDDQGRRFYVDEVRYNLHLAAKAGAVVAAAEPPPPPPSVTTEERVRALIVADDLDGFRQAVMTNPELLVAYVNHETKVRPIHVACFAHGCSRVLAWILYHSRVDINERADGLTPLGYAVHGCNIRAVDLLIAQPGYDLGALTAADTPAYLAGSSIPAAKLAELFKIMELLPSTLGKWDPEWLLLYKKRHDNKLPGIAPRRPQAVTPSTIAAAGSIPGIVATMSPAGAGLSGVPTADPALPVEILPHIEFVGGSTSAPAAAGAEVESKKRGLDGQAHSPIPTQRRDDGPVVCVVCMDRVPDTIVTPCMHKVVCKTCSTALTADPVNSHVCVFCRSPIEGIYLMDEDRMQPIH